METGDACLNLGDGPGLGAPVIGCLADGTEVALTGEAARADGHARRHIEGRGWAAEELSEPNGTGRRPRRERGRLPVPLGRPHNRDAAILVRR